MGKFDDSGAGKDTPGQDCVPKVSARLRMRTAGHIHVIATERIGDCRGAVIVHLLQQQDICLSQQLTLCHRLDGFGDLHTVFDIPCDDRDVLSP